jgi:hypothetical protein
VTENLACISITRHYNRYLIARESWKYDGWEPHEAAD